MQRELFDLLSKNFEENYNYHYQNKGELKEIHKKELIKWYDGNIYDLSNEHIKKAIDILTWCFYEADNIELKPPQMRDQILGSAQIRFGLSRKKLTQLLIKSNRLIESGTQKKSKLIAFEGIDGSGKSVQISLIKEELKNQGYNILAKDFPVYNSFFGTELGILLSGKNGNSAITTDSKSMSLWYALDRWSEFKNIEIENFDFILLNRYTLSNVVYQGIRYKGHDDIDKWIFELEHVQLELPVPDIYIIFDIDPEVSIKNVENKGYRKYVGNEADVYERSQEILKKARKKYLELAEKYDHIHVVSVLNEKGKMKDKDKIYNEVTKILENNDICSI